MEAGQAAKLQSYRGGAVHDARNGSRVPACYQLNRPRTAFRTVPDTTETTCKRCQALHADK